MNHIPMEIDCEKHRDWLSSQVTGRGKNTPDLPQNGLEIYSASRWLTTIPRYLYMVSVHDCSHKDVLPRASNAESRHGNPNFCN